jgi:hypothetical protein
VASHATQTRAEKTSGTRERDVPPLSSSQLNHYNAFGFVVLRDYLTTVESRQLAEEHEVALDEAYRETPFDGTVRHSVQMLSDRTPCHAALAEDARFIGAARQMYGDDVFFAGVDSNRYVGASDWHSDFHIDPEQDCYGVKFCLFHDTVGPDSGALRVVPGSHTEPLHSQLRAAKQAAAADDTTLRTGDRDHGATLFGRCLPDVPCHVCSSNPGDVVAFDARCFHASYGGGVGRRMGTLQFYNNPSTPSQEAAATGLRGWDARLSREMQARPGTGVVLAGGAHLVHAYHLDWRANRSGSALRAQWIKRLGELRFLPPEPRL